MRTTTDSDVAGKQLKNDLALDAELGALAWIHTDAANYPETSSPM